jgi:GT2 family glycosyltransferase
MYRKKFDSHEEYPFLAWEPLETSMGLVRAAGVPTGFLRLTRKAMQTLWDGSETYTNGMLAEERAIFDLKIEDGTMYSEDYVMSKKLIKAGIPLWIDPNMTCNHEGSKVFQGNFKEWLIQTGFKIT